MAHPGAHGAVQRDVVLLGILLEGWGEREQRDLVSLRQRLEATVRVEQVADADLLHELLTRGGIRAGLDWVAQRGQQEAGALGGDLSLHRLHQRLSDRPRLL